MSSRQQNTPTLIISHTSVERLEHENLGHSQFSKKQLQEII